MNIPYHQVRTIREMASMEYYSSTFSVLVEWVKETASGLVTALRPNGDIIEQVEVETQYSDAEDNNDDRWEPLRIQNDDLTLEIMKGEARKLRSKYIFDYDRVLG